MSKWILEEMVSELLWFPLVNKHSTTQTTRNYIHFSNILGKILLPHTPSSTKINFILGTKTKATILYHQFQSVYINILLASMKPWISLIQVKSFPTNKITTLTNPYRTLKFLSAVLRSSNNLDPYEAVGPKTSYPKKYQQRNFPFFGQIILKVPTV